MANVQKERRARVRIVIIDFPIVELMDYDINAAWLLKYFQPIGLKCLHFGVDVD